MKALVFATLLASPAAFGATDTQVGFGPFVGGGRISTGGDVRHTSGYALSVERRWNLGAGLDIGPRLEVANAFVNTKEDLEGGEKRIATYDTRIVAAGITLRGAVGNSGTLAQAVYLSALAGRGYSKLTLDQSTDRTYMQNLYGKITGDYFSGELGASIPLKGDFGISLAFLGSLYRANQKDAPYSYQGDSVDADGNLSLVEGSGTPGDGSLDERAVIRTGAVKLALSLGF